MMFNEFKVIESSGFCQYLKANHLQNFSLHGQNIRCFIGVIAQQLKIFQFWHLISFLIFSSNPKRGDSHQLKLISGNILTFEERVHDFNSQEKGLTHQLIFLVHLQEPTQKNSSHVLTKILLLRKIVDGLSRRSTAGNYICFNVTAIVLFFRERNWIAFVIGIRRDVGGKVFVLLKNLLWLGLRSFGIAEFHSKNNNEFHNEQFRHKIERGIF